MLSEERINELARECTWFNGSHAITNFVRFARALEAELLSGAGEDAKDSGRLAFLYSGRPTRSMALVDLELRMLNRNIPTITEVRMAIDAAIDAAALSTLEGQKKEGV